MLHDPRQFVSISVGLTVHIVVMLAAFAVATVIAVGISTRAGRTTPTDRPH
ncbi:hypothetical protein ACI7YT_11705 [Microbacterium sp. M]|uniref:hypothetical protein n=1 Tax=Microbacterium sp. M TaxID=3377125 RepID=UPI003863CEEF